MGQRHVGQGARVVLGVNAANGKLQREDMGETGETHKKRGQRVRVRLERMTDNNMAA